MFQTLHSAEITKAIDTRSDFTIVSGLKVNFNKTQCMLLGQDKHNEKDYAT